MTPALWILLGVVVLIVSGIAIEHRLRRGKHVSLAARFARPLPAVPLGMEATDTDGFADIADRNAALARMTGAKDPLASWTAVEARPPLPYPEDETYAARYSGTHKGRH
jgi:hypothetical protein